MTLTPEQQRELAQAAHDAVDSYWAWYGQQDEHTQAAIDLVTRHVSNRCRNTLCQDAMAAHWLAHLGHPTAAAALTRNVLGQLGAYWADATTAAAELPDHPGDW